MTISKKPVLYEFETCMKERINEIEEIHEFSSDDQLELIELFCQRKYNL